MTEQQNGDAKRAKGSGYPHPRCCKLHATVACHDAKCKEQGYAENRKKLQLSVCFHSRIINVGYMDNTCLSRTELPEMTEKAYPDTKIIEILTFITETEIFF